MRSLLAPWGAFGAGGTAVNIRKRGRQCGSVASPLTLHTPRALSGFQHAVVLAVRSRSHRREWSTAVLVRRGSSPAGPHEPTLQSGGIVQLSQRGAGAWWPVNSPA
jgi:hypothetical protein